MRSLQTVMLLVATRLAAGGGLEASQQKVDGSERRIRAVECLQDRILLGAGGL